MGKSEDSNRYEDESDNEEAPLINKKDEAHEDTQLINNQEQQINTDYNSNNNIDINGDNNNNNNDSPFDLEVARDPAISSQLENLKPGRPLFLFLCTVIQVFMLAYSMYYNYVLDGTPIQIKPFNIMIGPSSTTLVKLGAKYTPCMVQTDFFNGEKCPSEYLGVSPPLLFEDENGTQFACGDLFEFCGLSGYQPGIQYGYPNQWWRYITAIFLHTGIIHLLANVIFQVKIGFPIERDIGTIRIFFIYMFSGVFGFLLSTNFSIQSPSVGSSGSLFGLLGLMLVEICFNWKIYKKPTTYLLKLGLFCLFSMVLGLLPYLDNFAHIGGFLMGTVTSLTFLHHIYYSSRDKKIKIFCSMVSSIIAIAMICSLFSKVYLIGVDELSCTWCKYLDCVPIVEGWCGAV